ETLRCSRIRSLPAALPILMRSASRLCSIEANAFIPTSLGPAARLELLPDGSAMSPLSCKHTALAGDGEGPLVVTAIHDGKCIIASPGIQRPPRNNHDRALPPQIANH